jgi:hypothetical protein
MVPSDEQASILFCDVQDEEIFGCKASELG